MLIISLNYLNNSETLNDVRRYSFGRYFSIFTYSNYLEYVLFCSIFKDVGVQEDYNSFQFRNLK